MLTFNQAQKEAMAHTEGPCQVLAGPGSGKTTVITQRIKNLIEEHGVPPQNILVITFTKAAAQEMQQRFKERMEGRSLPVSFGTFHAVFFTILKYAYHYSADNIIREEMKYEYLREIIDRMELEISDEKEFTSNLLNEISTVKGGMVDVEHYYSKNCAEEIFKKIYRKYNEKLQRENLIDFDDMLILCYELLSQREDILRLWQEKYRYILIDEFQDIDRVQYETIKLLARPENNLFIVGDDDQSIYRFRGANPEIMLNFSKDFPDAKTVMLDVNYRSTGAIIRAAGKLIQNNKRRFAKTITAVKEEGIAPEVLEFETVYQESEYILSEIRDYVECGYEYKDIAILYRTNSNPRQLVEKMMECQIPFRMKDVVPNIYEHFIAKDIFAYLQAARDSANRGRMKRADLLRIINKPKRYVSREILSCPEMSLDELYMAYQDKKRMQEHISKFSYDLGMLRNMNPFAAITYIRKAIGYDEYLEEYAKYRRMKPEELFDTIEELAEMAKSSKTYEEWLLHASEYGEELKAQRQRYAADKNGVEFSTMHSAKGLEYRVVFLIDANESITPHKKAMLPEDMEEERRLFYVAMTRAKECLHIYSCKQRYGRDVNTSRFVDEVCSPLFDIKTGTRLMHRKFGEGEVRRIQNGKLWIAFPDKEEEMYFDANFCFSKGILTLIKEKR